MNTPVKVKAATLPMVPQTRDEASAAIAEIGRLERELTRLDADLRDKLAVVKESFERQAAALKLKRDALFAGLKTFCEGRRDELTVGGKSKTVTFPAGKVAWRLRPPSVTLRGVKAVLEALKQKGLTAFIRTIEEVNKDAILADPEKVADIKGITVASSGEDFIVEPFSAEGIEGAKG